MAVLFLLLAAIVGVVLGDAWLANTGPGSAELFNRSFTDFTQGQFLVISAGLGFLFALFLSLAWGSSNSRRAKRRERRLIRRDLESRVDELERENGSLREELDRATSTTRLSGMGTERDTRVPETVPPTRDRERTAGDGNTIRDRLTRGDRVEEPARPPRA
jgi:hypothetical protein